MACASDIKYAILNRAFEELIDGRNTFSRVSDDTIQINGKADNSMTKAQHRAQARAIARDLISRVNKSFNGYVKGEILEPSQYEPLMVRFEPDAKYIKHELDKYNNPEEVSPNNIYEERNFTNANTGINTDYQIDNFEPRESDSSIIVGTYNKYKALKRFQYEDYLNRLNRVKADKREPGLSVDKIKSLNDEERRLKNILYGNNLTGIHEIKGLRQEIEDLDKEDNGLVKSVGFYIEKDLDRLTKLANSNNLDDVNEAEDLIRFYDQAGTFDGSVENPFFTKEDIFLQDENGNITAKHILPESVMNQYKKWRDRAISMRPLVDAAHKQITVDQVNNNPLVKATYGNRKFTYDELTYEKTGLKDTDWVSMWVMDSTHGIASTNGLIPQVMMSTLRTNIEHREEWSRQLRKDIDEMDGDVKRELINLGHDFSNNGILGIKAASYNIFKQVSKEGNESHNLVQRYSKEQLDRQSRALNIFENDFSKARAMSDFTQKQRNINLAFDKLKKFKRDNLHILDIQKMDDPEYRAKMESILGKKGYDEVLSQQQDLLNKYEADRLNIIETVLARNGKTSYDELDIPSKNAIKLWENRHNPTKGIEDYNSVSGIFFGDTRDNNFMDYNIFIPRKYIPEVKSNIDTNKFEFKDTGKETDNYDKNFSIIENNPVLSKFYDKLKEFCEVLHENLPPELQEKTGVYTIPELNKTSSEFINDKNNSVISAISSPFRRLFERIKDGFGVNKQSEVSYAAINPITGKANYKVNDWFLRKNTKAIQDRILIEQTKFLQTLNSTLPDNEKLSDINRFTNISLSKLNSASLLLLSNYLHTDLSLIDANNRNIDTLKNKLNGNNVEIGKLIADYSLHSVVQSQSFDLPKIMRYFSDLTMAYAARQESLPILEIMKKHYDSIQKPETNNMGIGLFNKNTGEYMKNGLRTRAYKQLDEAFNRVVLQRRDIEHWGDLKKKIYSSEEKKRMKELDELIDKEPDEARRKRLVNIRDSLGKTATVSAAYENLLNWIRTLRLGYNVSSMITNYAEGVISNVILGSSDEFFDPKELIWAYNANKHSFIKNVTFGFATSDLAKKVRGFVDKFNVIIDNKNELQKSSYRGFSDRAANLLGPFEGNSRVEYLNQSPLMIAILRTMKIKDKNGNESSVWDAFDNDINLKPEFKTEENIRNWVENGDQRQIFSQKLNSAITLGHGNYDVLRGMLIKANPIGKLGMMFKTWLPEQIFWRFAKEQDMISLGKMGYKGRYWSYGGGSGAVHGATVMGIMFGPIGALIGAGVGLGAGLATGTNTGGGFIGLIKESLLTTKQLILRSIGLPINLLAGRQIINDVGAKNAFEKWVGKGTFTKQDEYNMKANMTDLAIQVALLAMIMAVKAALWDDDDKPDNPERKAHNVLVNKLMQTSSQLASYVNPVDTYHNTIGSMAVIQYLTDVSKLLDKVQNWANGNDILTSGVNAGKSGLGIQFRKTFLPGLFKDTSLGFGSMENSIYPQDSPWGKYFHSAEYYHKQELKQDRSELRNELLNSDQYKSIEDEDERRKAVNKEVERRIPSDRRLEQLGETREDYNESIK